MAIFLGFKPYVINAYAALVGQKPGSTALNDHLSFISNPGVGVAGYKAALESYFATTSSAALATALLTNLGLTGIFTQAQAEAFLAANPGNRVGAIIDLSMQLYSYNGTNAQVFAAKTAYASAIDASNAYSATNANGESLATTAGKTFTLTTGIDNLTGTAFGDVFLARTINSGNSFNDGDSLDGGAGADTVYLDFVGIGNAITPVLRNIETVVVRAQSAGTDANGTDSSDGNNQTGGYTVQIDAQRSLAVDSANKVTAAAGVTQWESSNSRSDVIIEDVRIGNDQKTKDVTIAFRESDPGNVDFGVYFDQHSLRNAGSGTSTLVIQIMDTGAAAAVATSATPLLNNPLDTFRIGINGTLQSISLNSAAAPAAAANADTYAQLLAAFQAALLASGSTATAALGADFTVIDPLSGKSVTGKSIVLTGGAGITFSDTVPGSGWVNTTGAAVPNSSNIFTTFSTGATNVTELVTSKVILDDVGRGSTGGDLVIGGMSVGSTSTSRGVERFEISVEDSSKLQTINGTNNALREVTIVNGTTSNSSSAYNTVVPNAGNLTVNGKVANSDVTLVGVDKSGQAVHDNAGFTDVRLIDGSAMIGSLAFTAAITSDTIAKYVTQVDTAANPFADVAGTGNINFNVPGANFVYTGGANDDTMFVTLDSGVFGSRSTIVSGLSDVTFVANGGAGNDKITVTLVDQTGQMAGGAQAWYANQKLNANVAINGGDGNDTIRTPGAGDIIIDAGAGNDTVYTDNTGALAATAQANTSGTLAAIAYANAAAAELAAGQAARVLSNAIGPVTSDGRFDGTPAGSAIAPATVVAELQAIDALTPTNPPALPVIAHAALAAATATAAANGAITLAQKIALDAAYNSATGGVITPAIGISAPATLVGHVGVAGNVTAGELVAGDALLATYVTAAKAAVTADAAASANVTAQNALLNASQLAVVTAFMAINGVEDLTTGGIEIGSANVVSALTTLQSALVNGASQASAVAAINAASAKGLFGAAVFGATTAADVLTAVGAGAMDAADAAAVVALLSPIANAAAIDNATKQATYTAALATDATAVNTAANIVAADPVTAGASAVANDFVGSTEAAAAALTAATNLTRANVDVAASTAINSALAGLKAAINVGTLDAGITIAFQNANAAIGAAITNSATNGTGAVVTNPLTLNQAALLVLVGSPGNAVDAAEELAFDTGALGIFNANSVDSLVIANTVQTDRLTAIVADRAATATATATASSIAAAAAASGSSTLSITAPTAVFVFNTSNQTASYNKATMDDRNLADLKSDANNSYNFFNSTLKVTYKGIDVSLVVAGSGFKTTDLELNQAIKLAINSDPVLSKLLLATDGPANTLVVTSLIDGAQVLGNLALSVTMPTSAGANVAAAAAAYGLAVGSTDAQVIAAMATAKTAFDTKGDYVTQWAESGANAGNTNLTGANSVSSSDNTITPGTGNDVIVLGTTVGIDSMSSSNEQVIYSGTFGNDTIVYFAASGLGIDTLNFSALNGRGSAFGSLSADKSIVVGAPVATALTAVQIAALFTDSATAINHVYVAVDSTNIGSIWQVADAAGTAAGGVVATLVGSIDLADTAWASLTAANFI